MTFFLKAPVYQKGLGTWIFQQIEAKVTPATEGNRLLQGLPYLERSLRRLRTSCRASFPAAWLPQHSVARARWLVRRLDTWRASPECTASVEPPSEVERRKGRAVSTEGEHTSRYNECFLLVSLHLPVWWVLPLHFPILKHPLDSFYLPLTSQSLIKQYLCITVNTEGRPSHENTIQLIHARLFHRTMLVPPLRPGFLSCYHYLFTNFVCQTQFFFWDLLF